MKTAELLVRCLQAEGVDHVFGIPGEENLEVMDAIHQAGLHFVLTRHEQAAAFMAGTVGRLTGRPGVCLSTLGPGATNLVSGVADAYLSNLPMIALVSQAGEARRNPPQKQVLDLVAMFRPLAKKVLDVNNPQELPATVRRAFALAGRERTGPVVLQLPEDIMKRESPGEALDPVPPRRMRSVPTSITQIRRLLERSEKPLAIIGHGVLRENAVVEVREFLASWGIPAGCTWMASGALPYDHPLSLGTIGMRNSDLAKEAYDEADLVALIGYDATEFQPQYWNRGREKTVVYMGRGGPGKARELKVSASAEGDLVHTLGKLIPKGAKAQEWYASHQGTMRRATETPSSGPKGLVQALRRQMGRQDIVVSDVGAHLIWLAKFYPTYEPNTLLLQNGLIPMGVAVPSAIAARMLHPERRVVAVAGDGGFLMSSSELETAKRLGVNFVTVIFNDGGLGLIREKMMRGLGRASNVDLGFPDIPTYARSFGAEGYSVHEKEFEAVLKDCLSRNALAVIDVKVDYSHNCDLF